MAFGRIGNVLAVYVGGFALDRGGPPGYFTSWAILMALVFVSLAVVRRHVPRSSVGRTRQPAAGLRRTEESGIRDRAVTFSDVPGLEGGPKDRPY